MNVSRIDSEMRYSLLQRWRWMHRMRIPFWKSLQRDGEQLHIWFSCFSGTSCFLDQDNDNDNLAYCNSSLATNIIVSSMLILGGSATVTDLTGMSTIAVWTYDLDNTKLRSRVYDRPASLFRSVLLSTSLPVECELPFCAISTFSRSLTWLYVRAKLTYTT